MSNFTPSDDAAILEALRAGPTMWPFARFGLWRKLGFTYDQLDARAIELMDAEVARRPLSEPTTAP